MESLASWQWALQALRYPTIDYFNAQPWDGVGKYLRNLTQTALAASQYAPLSEIRKFQNTLLTETLEHFINQNQFYRNLLVQKNIPLDSICSLEGLPSLPLLTRSILKQIDPKILYSKGISRPRFLFTSTSGSTGEPFRFPMDLRYWSILGRTNFFRLWDWAGVDPRDPTVSCAGARLARSTPNTIHVPPDELATNLSKFISQIKKANTRIIRGYPQTNFEFARMIREKEKDIFFDTAFFLGNTLPDSIRNFFIKEFKTEVFNVYATQEFGTVAGECEYHSDFHINEESFIVEVTDSEGTPLPDGTRGQIVITAFQNQIMPFIRYAIGDVGTIIKGDCPCGRTLRRMRLEGRNEEMMIRPDDTFMTPIKMRHVLDKYCSEIRRYRVTQIDQDHLQFEVALTSPHAISSAKCATQELSDYAGNLMHVELVVVDDIPLSPEGKLQCYTSKLWRDNLQNTLKNYSTT